jgi:predicted oxidoreductase
LPTSFSKDYIALAVNNSLRRLRTGYIDILYLHCPTADALADDELLDFLDRMEAAGKIRKWGVSCDTIRAVELAMTQPRIKLVQADISHLNAPAQMRPKSLVVRGLSHTASFQSGNMKHAFNGALNMQNAIGIIIGTMNLEHMRENVRSFKEATVNVSP